jgi:hypothetical protein
LTARKAFERVISRVEGDLDVEWSLAKSLTHSDRQKVLSAANHTTIFDA